MKKRRLPRFFAMLLVAALLLNTVLIDPGTVTAEAPDSFTYIEVGDIMDVTISYSGEEEYFCFIPEVSGTYTVYSSDSDCDPVASVLDANGYWLTGGDDDIGMDFSINYYMEAGVTYYLDASAYRIGSYDLHLEYGAVDMVPEYSDIREGESVYLGYLTEPEYFRIVPESSGYYIIYSSDSTCDPWVTVYDGNWYEQTGGDNENGSDFSVTWYLEAGNAYYLATGMHDSGYYNLNLVYRELDVDYTDIHVGDSEYVTIDSGYEFEYYRFIPETSGSYTFYSGNHAGDPKAYLLDRAGNELAYSDDYDGSNFSITCDLVAGDIYYLQAGMWSDRTGSYTLYLVAGDQPEEPVEPEGPDYFGAIHAGNGIYLGYLEASVYLSFVPDASGYYSFYSSDSTCDPWASLCDEDWCELAYSNDYTGNDFSITCYLDEGVTYYLLTGMYTSGSFTLNLVYGEPEPDEPDEPDEYTDIYADNSYVITIDDYEEGKYFRFIPQTSGYYTFYSSDRSCDPYAYLLDENGAVLVNNDDGEDLNFSITYQLEAGETYYLEVFAFQSGSFTLHVVTGDQPEEPVSPEGADYYGTIHAGNGIYLGYLEDSVYFSFVPNASGYYTFYSSDSTCDPWASLYDEDWYELAYSNDYTGNDFSITRYLDAGETYYYVVGMNTSGSFTLHLVAGEPEPEEPDEPDEPEGPDWPEYDVGDADQWDGTIANAFGGGNGSQGNPYLIYTAEQLAYLAYTTNNGNSYVNSYFKLMNDLDLNNLEWTPIGEGIMTGKVEREGSYFSGYFDGNFHVIYNLRITNGATSYNGLFGDVYGGSLVNLGIVNAYVSGYSIGGLRMNNGALAGRLQDGLVERCFVKNADIYAYTHDDPANAGLLLGNVRVNAAISNCYAHGAATTNSSAGGLIGACYSAEDITVAYCYAWADVNYQFNADDDAGDTIGGLCGFTSGEGMKFNSCFFVGSLNSSNDVQSHTIADDYTAPYLENCFYNTGYSDTYQGTFIDTDSLQSMNWIENSLAWEFDSIWTFMAGEPYPVLQGFVLNGSGGGDIHVHTPGQWIVDAEPTCTASGSKHTECTECGSPMENVYLPALGHNYQSAVTKEATCTEPGVVTHTCSRCADSYLTYIYSQHSYCVSARQEATCTVDGFITYTCSSCGDSYQEIIKGGHRYIAEITLVATPDSDGAITYTCEICGNSYVEVIPARPDAKVLLIQDRLPWSENNNVSLLNKMQADGYITGWDMTTTGNFSASMLASYGVVLIANDQTTATYNQLRDMQDALVSFANAGGVVIYGACDQGWAAGSITYMLPMGAEKTNYYSNHNYIVDPGHPIVTGSYTDGKALTNALLYGTYCSHTSFSNLPADANVILQDGRGNPTLVEYSVGNGHVILSGLTWEFYYTRNVYNALTNDTFTKNVYDDLILYALQLSDPCDHVYDTGAVVDPSCTEAGYVLHTCSVCGGTMKDNFVDAYGHTPGEWVVVEPATAAQAGLRIVCCEVCGETLEQEIIPMLNAPVISVVADTETVILGQTFDAYIVIEELDPVKSVAFVPVYDADLFELVSVQWLKQATIQTVDPEIISAWNAATDINGSLVKLTFRAKGLTSGSRITAEAYAQNDDGLVQLSVVGDSIAVMECPHEQWQVNAMGDLGHLKVCTCCGMNELAAHTFDHGCDKFCNDCGYERETAHVSDGQLYFDDFTHWELCSECYATMNTHRHEFEDTGDLVCEICGYVRPIRGDVDGDGDVDTDDAILVLMHYHFPENYFLNQHGDMDGNGVVDSDDSIYLLMYTYFREEYPLYDPYVK